MRAMALLFALWASCATAAGDEQLLESFDIGFTTYDKVTVDRHVDGHTFYHVRTHSRAELPYKNRPGTGIVHAWNWYTFNGCDKGRGAVMQSGVAEGDDALRFEPWISGGASYFDKLVPKLCAVAVAHR